MATTLEALLAVPLEDKVHTYTERDTILYALGIGVGLDPGDEADLRFIYETELQPLPTLPVVLGAARIRDLNLGINYLKAVHGEQSLVLHKLPPVAGTVVTRSRLAGVLDKGAVKGVVILLRREVFEHSSNTLIATTDMTLFARGDGGIGSSVAELPAARVVPDRAADLVLKVPTSARAALIYRLSGDLNPLHIDPAVARQAGFDRPILHGLATYGLIGHAVVKHLCGNDPARLKSLAGRFSAPVFPGESIELSVWREEGGVSLRAAVPDRKAVVFNNGFAALEGGWRE
jgi:acyl dehydratase